MSSNPITATSSGMRNPSRVAPPRARRSPGRRRRRTSRSARSSRRSSPAASTRACSRPWRPRRSSAGAGSMPARAAPGRNPSRRCSLEVNPNGFVRTSPTKPIRRWPLASRCSAASWPPWTSSITTCGTRGMGRCRRTPRAGGRAAARATSSSASGSEITSSPSTRSRRAKSRIALPAAPGVSTSKSISLVAALGGPLGAPAQPLETDGVVKNGATTPIACVSSEATGCAPSSWGGSRARRPHARTLSRSSDATTRCSLSTRETVATLTSACRATSRIVGGRRGPRVRGPCMRAQA